MSLPVISINYNSEFRQYDIGLCDKFNLVLFLKKSGKRRHPLYFPCKQIGMHGVKKRNTIYYERPLFLGRCQAKGTRPGFYQTGACRTRRWVLGTCVNTMYIRRRGVVINTTN